MPTAQPRRCVEALPGRPPLSKAISTGRGSDGSADLQVMKGFFSCAKSCKAFWSCIGILVTSQLSRLVLSRAFASSLRIASKTFLTSSTSVAVVSEENTVEELSDDLAMIFRDGRGGNGGGSSPISEPSFKLPTRKYLPVLLLVETEDRRSLALPWRSGDPVPGTFLVALERLRPFEPGLLVLLLLGVLGELMLVKDPVLMNPFTLLASVLLKSSVALEGVVALEEPGLWEGAVLLNFFVLPRVLEQLVRAGAKPSGPGLLECLVLLNELVLWVDAAVLRRLELAERSYLMGFSKCLTGLGVSAVVVSERGFEDQRPLTGSLCFHSFILCLTVKAGRRVSH